MPLWPVNQRTPRRSNVAVFRFAQPAVAGSGNRRTRFVRGSTRTIALRPLSVIHAAPSGPTITPCGDEPEPSAISRDLPVFGFSQPSSPEACAVYQTPPSRARATSCGCVPAGTGNSFTCSGVLAGDAAPAAVTASAHTRTSARRIIPSVRDRSASGLGRVALLVGAVARAHERPGENGAEAERL